MGVATDRLRAWLDGLPRQDGLYLASPPRSFGAGADGEQEYAEQFTTDAAFESQVAEGLVGVLEAVGADLNGPALEVGAGTGIFSRPLVAAGLHPWYLISDASPDFLARLRPTMPETASGDIDFVVLDGDALEGWPPGTLSLVALRYALHHVLDWEGFIHAASACLRPGGVLVVEEPLADGYLLQAMLASVVLRSPAMASELSAQVREDLELFVGTTFWYLRTGVDKAPSEDKHVFPVARLLEVCRQAGLEPELHQNLGLDERPAVSDPESDYFVREMRHNLRVNFGFGDETIRCFDEHVVPACAGLPLLDGRRCGPAVRGTVVARRTARPLTAQVRQAARTALRSGGRRLPDPVRARIPEGVRRRLRTLG